MGLLDPRSCPLQARVEDISQGVPEQVDTQDGHEDAQAGKERQPPGSADIDATVGQHRSPGWDLGGDTQPEEAQAGLPDDRRGHRERADDEAHLDQVREDVMQDDTAVARPQRTGSADEITGP